MELRALLSSRRSLLLSCTSCTRDLGVYGMLKCSFEKHYKETRYKEIFSHTDDSLFEPKEDEICDSPGSKGVKEMISSHVNCENFSTTPLDYSPLLPKNKNCVDNNETDFLPSPHSLSCIYEPSYLITCFVSQCNFEFDLSKIQVEFVSMETFFETR